jgi:hypothetical protein
MLWRACQWARPASLSPAVSAQPPRCTHLADAERGVPPPSDDRTRSMSLPGVDVSCATTADGCRSPRGPMPPLRGVGWEAVGQAQGWKGGGRWLCEPAQRRRARSGSRGAPARQRLCLARAHCSRVARVGALAARLLRPPQNAPVAARDGAARVGRRLGRAAAGSAGAGAAGAHGARRAVTLALAPRRRAAAAVALGHGCGAPAKRGRSRAGGGFARPAESQLDARRGG